MLTSEVFAMYTRHIKHCNYSKSQIAHSKKCGSLLVDFFGDINIEKLTENMVYDWEDWLENKRCQNTVRQYVLTVRSVLQYCRKKDIQCLDATILTTPKRNTTTPAFLEASEVSKMIDQAFDIRAKFVISFLYSSGIRVTEFTNLNRGQIHDRQFTIIGKGQKERICFIDARTEELMEKYLATREDFCDALVVSKIDKIRLTKSTIELIVKNAAKRAGITKHVTPHTLRHSFATNFLENNGNIKYLAELMGHAKLDTTSIYTHIVNNDLKSQYQRFHSV